MARVLVADDDSAIRDVITSTCKLDKHDVQSCATSAEAIAAYATFQPDLMILDVNMPGGGAKAILAALEEQLGHPPCPVIVVSGDAEESPDHPCIRDAIQKPFGIDSLRIATKTALAAGGQ